MEAGERQGMHPQLPSAPRSHACPLSRRLNAPQVKAFDEEASSLALHPGGYLLAAGFADKLRLMAVLAGEGLGGPGGG